MNNSEVKKLYTALLSKGYSTDNIGDEDTFVAKMGDKANRKELYDWVSSNGDFRLGDYDSYEQRLTDTPEWSNMTYGLNPRVSRESDAPIEPKESAKGSLGSLGSLGSNKESDTVAMSRLSLGSEKPRLEDGSGKSKDERSGSVLDSQFSTSDLKEPVVPQRTFMDNNAYHKKSGAERLAEDAGRRMELYATRPLAGRIRVAERELAELQEQAQARFKDATDGAIADRGKSLGDRFISAFTSAADAQADGQAYRPDWQQRLDDDSEYQTLQLAIREKEEALQNMRDEWDAQHGADVGFWRGFGRVMGDVRSWDFGMGDLRDAGAMMQIQQKVERGMELNDTEKAAMQAMVERQETEDLFGGNRSWWYRSGEMGGHLLPFMKDFIGTGGGFKMISAAGKVSADLGAKAAVKMGIKEAQSLGYNGLKSYIKGEGLKSGAWMYMKQHAAPWLIKSTGETIDALALRAPLMTNTIQGAGTASEIIDKKLGKAVQSGDGQYSFKNDESWGNAIWQVEADKIIENASEMSGEHIDKVLGKVFGGVHKGLSKLTPSGYQKAYETIRKGFEKAGVSSFFGEVGEEYTGQLWRTIAGLESAQSQVTDENGRPVFDENGRPVMQNNFKSGDFHADIWRGMALTMLLPGAGKAALTGLYGQAKYQWARHQVNKADARGAAVWGDEWEGVRAAIDMATNDQIGELAEMAMTDPDMSEAEREAAMDYMERLENLRGWNLASIGASQDATSDDGGAEALSAELGEAYSDGYSSGVTAESVDVKNRMIQARERVVEELGEAITADIEADPIGAIGKLGDDDAVNRKVIDYLNARMVYDGMMESARHTIDAEIAKSDALVDARTNRTTGMVIGATMKVGDRRVYVMDGTLAIENGELKIEKEGSPTLIVRDAETGALEMVSEDAILEYDEPQEASLLKASAAEAIRNSRADEMSNMIDGVVSFAEGDVYTLADGAQITVVANEEGVVDNGDGTVNVSDGKEVSSMPKSVIQQMVDEANKARVRDESGKSKDERSGSDVKPEYAQNDVVVLRDEAGNVVRGSIEEINDDGVLVAVENPTTGMWNTKQYKAEDINSRIVGIERDGEVIYSKDDKDSKGFSDVKDGSNEANGSNGIEKNILDPRTMSDMEKQRRGDLLRNAPVIEVKREAITSTPILSARKAAEKWWDENVGDPALYNTEVGEVEINRNSVESSLAHRYGQKKLDAITSLVEGFENAVYLGTMEDGTRQEGVLNHYFAYPIMYDGELNYVFCRAMQDANKNRLYVHEVFVADKIKKGDTLQTAASQPHGGISLYRDILTNVLETSTESTVSESEISENGGEKQAKSSKVDENGHPFVVSSDGTTIFGEIREDSGLTPAPIKLSQGYQDENGKGYGLAHIEANHGEQIRNAGFETVEEFVRYVAQNYDEENIRVGKRRQNGSTTYLIQVTDEYDNTLFVEMSRDGSYWNVNSAGIFRKGYSNKKETVAKTEPQQPNNAISTESSLSMDEESGISSTEPNGESTVSEGESSEKGGEKQAKSSKVDENRLISALERIPKNEKGQPDFDAATAEDAWAALVEMNEGDELEADDTARQMAEVYRKKLKAAEKKPVTGADPMAIQQSKSAKKAEVSRLQGLIEHWEGVSRHGEEARKAAEYAAEVERAKQKAESERLRSEAKAAEESAPRNYAKVYDRWELPMTFRDYLLRAISSRSILFKWNDSRNGSGGLGRHLGLSNSAEERRRRMWMLDETDGFTPEEAAERALSDFKAVTGMDPHIDEMDALNELLDVLGSHDTSKSMWEEAKRNHDMLEQTEPEYDEAEMEREQWYWDNFHLSSAEYAAYNEMIMESMSPLEEEDYNELISELSDEQTREEGLRQGSDNVLQESRTISGGGVAEVEGGTTSAGVGVDNTDGVAPVDGEVGKLADNVRKQQRQTKIAPHLGGKYSLSSEKANNGEVFFQNEDGSTSLAAIPEEIFDKLGINPVPFKLTETMGWHVFDHHAKEAKFRTIDDAIDFVLSIINNVDHVRLGRDNSYIFSVEDGRSRVGRRAVTIVVNSETGEFMGIRTSGYETLGKLQERPLLWKRGANAVSEDVATPTITTTKPQQGDEDASRTKGQSNESSAGKGSEKRQKSNELGEKVDGGSFFGTPHHGATNVANSIEQKVAEAEAEVNTNPTEKQKEAGNYKKGHVKIGTFNVTIEQPKGSVRSGVDANGKKWEVEMQNTYGYIRGTEGVDGDHIDVFLSDDIDGWNGRKVFVIDQYNEDGTFDEHKVMLGFNDIDEAYDAYLSNYESGWDKTRKIGIRPADIEFFEKWIASSHRKTKPFNEYKNVQIKEQREGKDDKVSKDSKGFKDGKAVTRNTVRSKKQSGVGVDKFDARKFGMTKKEANHAIDMAISMVSGKSMAESKAERAERENERKAQAKELYDAVLSGEFNDVTLQLIDNYISDVTPENPYGKRISQRVPQAVERKVYGGKRTSAVDLLFSRISESAVPASERASKEGRRRIEEKKKELLKGWAIATGNWHTDLSAFVAEEKPFDSGKDSDVYYSKKNGFVVKASKGKPIEKRFPIDLDNIPLFNYYFPNAAYEILGYGEIDGNFVRIFRQPMVHFAEDAAVSEAERVEYMEQMGFRPLNKANTAFTNDDFVVADLQKANIVRDSQGGIRVIDADMKLHTVDLGGNYDYPPVEEDTRLRGTSETMEEKKVESDGANEANMSDKDSKGNSVTQLVKGAKWEQTGEPEKFKTRVKKHADSHDVLWKIGKKQYGSTTAERDLLRILADEYDSLEAIWNAYENGEILLSKNEAAILKKLIETGTENPTLERAKKRTNDALKSAGNEYHVEDAATGDEMSRVAKLATEAALTMLKESGIEVVEATDAMTEAVIRMAKPGVELSAKKKRALETASVQEDEHQPTVVSSADGAKVLNNLDSVASEYEEKSNQPKTFLGDVAKAIGAERKGSGSQYATFETKNGKIVTIRLSNHNAKVSNFDNNGEFEGISIVVSAKGNKGITNDGEAHIVEYYYDAIKLRRAEGKPLSEIVGSIKQALYSGEFTDTTGLAERQEVNLSEIEAHIVYHGSAAKFDAFDHSHMGEGEGAQAYGWGTYVTEVEGIGRAYANEAQHSLAGDEVNKYSQRIIDGERYIQKIQDEINELSSITNFPNPSEKIKVSSRLNQLYKKLEMYKQELDSDKAELKTWEAVAKEEGGRQLYTVEIPEDNGSNYLSWDAQVEPEQAERINAGLQEIEETLNGYESGDTRLMYERSGEQIYNRLQMLLGSDKAASEVLARTGFVGIKYPAQHTTSGRADGASNYVIFNEADAKIVNRVEFMRTPTGTVYGWTDGKKVYLTKAGMNPETPIHEYTHLWARAMMQRNPEGWASIKELLRGTPVWNAVMNDANYADIRGNEDAVASEVLSRVSGKENAKRMEAEARKLIDEADGVFAKAEAVTLIERIKQALQEFWNWVGVNLFDIKSFGSIEEVTDRVLWDLIENSELKVENGEIEKQIIGERGAAALDKAEEASHRMDNLGVAREMEAAFEAKNARIEKLRKSAPIIASGNEYVGKYELNNKSANRYILDNLRGEYINKDTGTPIRITRKGADKVTRHDAENDIHLKSIVLIPQMIENAIFITEETNDKSKNEYDSFRYYVVGLNINDVDYTAKLAVGVKNGETYYDHALTEFEKSKLLEGIDSIKREFANEELLFDIKDKRLLSLLQTNAKENARRIKMATGWERGADGKWRYEITDEGITFDIDGNVDFVKRKPAEYKDYKRYRELLHKKNALAFEGKVLSEAEQKEYDNLAMIWKGTKLHNSHRLKDYMDYPELFEAYPELRDMSLSFDDIKERGYYDPIGNHIVLSKSLTPTEAKNALIHEIQHAIQDIEGFAKGGNVQSVLTRKDELKADASRLYEMMFETPEWGEYVRLTDRWFDNDDTSVEPRIDEINQSGVLEAIRQEQVRLRKKYGNDANVGKILNQPYAMDAEIWDRLPEGFDDKYDAYRRLGGEVEARNASARMGMTEEERRATLLAETEDVAREDQIFLMENGGVSSSEAEAIDKDGKGIRVSKVGKDGADDVLYRDGEEAARVERAKAAYDAYCDDFGEVADVELFESPDELYDFAIALGENEESARDFAEIYTEDKDTPALYDAVNDKIFIFAWKECNPYRKLFHESIHRAVEHLGGIGRYERLSEELAAIDKKLAKRIGKFYNRDLHEEMITHSLEIALTGNAIEELREALSEESQQRLNEILNEVGYDERRDSEADVARFEPDLESRAYQRLRGQTRRRYGRVGRGIYNNVGETFRSEQEATSDRASAYNANEALRDDVSGSELSRDGEGAYSDDEVSWEQDFYGKVLGKPYRRKKQRIEFAARERRRMVERVQELAQKLGLDNVEIVTDASALDGKKQRAKGYFSKSTGKITIVIPNHLTVEDAVQTLLHEAVAHYGLRKLFGEHFDTFLDNVFNNADEGIRRRIVALATKNGWDFRTATEEYLASLAEQTNFEDLDASWWQKIKRMFVDMLHKIGFDGFSGVTLSDSELRYVLWRSYENLKNPTRFGSIFGEAEDVAKQYELGVGNYGREVGQGDVAAEGEAESLAVVNERFNEELQQQIDGTLPNGHIYQLGMASAVLQSAGLPNLPIELAASRLSDKSMQENHPFELSEVKGLVESVQKPLAVFRSATHIGSFVVLTELQHNGKNYVVAIEANRKQGRIEINSIRSVHYRNSNTHIANWIKDGLLEYADKKRMSEWFSKQRYNSADVRNLFRHSAKIVENFENPISEDDVLYRDGGGSWEQAEYDRRVRTKRKENPDDKAATKRTNRAATLHEAYLDGMRSVRVLQEVVSAASGKPIEDYENAYMHENHMSSRNKAAEEAYMRDYFKPLCEAVAKVCEGKPEAYKELLDYIIAKHGLERNAYMRNEAIKNGATDADQTDYSGLTALTGKDDVAEAEAEAQRMVDAYEQAHETAELWQRINAATAETLKTNYEGGLIGKDTYDKISSQYQYYVPLKGWDETTAIDVYEYASGGVSMSPSLMRAYGRESVADDPLATIMVDAEKAIMESNRNKMKQKFLNLALNHQSDLLTVSRQWYVEQADGSWLPSNPVIPVDASADMVDAIVKQHEGDMQALKKQGKAQTRRSGLQLGVIATNADATQHVVKVKRNGETYCIYVNGDPRAARAINGMLNPDAGEQSKAKEMAQEVKNFMTKTLTTWNPEFMVGNLARDVIFSEVAVAVKEDGKYFKKYSDNIGSVLVKGALPRLLYKWEHGTLDDRVEIERYFKEFLMNGGETGFTQLNTIEKTKKEMARFLREAQGGVANMPKKAWRGLWNGVEFLNRSAEDTTRFTVYMTSRQMGRSVARSVHDAKEITVNFNRKGSGELGAKYMGFLYFFFNAALQSVANAGRMVKRHPKKASAAMLIFASAGFLLPPASCVMASLWGDDDDEYWNLPEWVRRNNLVFYIPWMDKFVTIPIPHELRAFYGMGEIAFSVLCGKETVEDGIRKAVEGLTGMLPVDFTGNGGDAVVSLSPSIVQPIVQVSKNVDYFGKPIYKDTPWNKEDPEWTKAYKNTNPTIVGLTRKLSEAGSTTDEYGVVDYPEHIYTGDVNPAMLEHLLESYTGGLGKTLNGTAKTISMMWDKENRELRNVPILRKFIQGSDERAEERRLNNEYYKLKDEHEELKKYLRELTKLDKGRVLDVADRVTRWIETEEGERYLLLDNYIKNLNTLNRYMNEDIDEEARAYYQERADSIKREFVKLATEKPTEELEKDAS